MTGYSRADVYTHDVGTEPKYMFRWLVNHAAELGLLPGKLLDIGAATGAFQRYVLERFPDSEAVGVEYDPILVAAGQSIYGTGLLIQGDANDLSALPRAGFDCVFMTGVHSIFEDIEPVLDQCLKVARPGGAVIVTGLFNDFPLDARISWRYPNRPGDSWHPGYNLFSKETIAVILGKNDRVESHSYEPFRMPFALEPQKDPVRSWTFDDGTGQDGFALRNGLMPLNMQRLTIRLS